MYYQELSIEIRCTIEIHVLRQEMSASPGGCAGANWKLLTEGCDGSSLDMVRPGKQ